jgi:hypothetical protein
MAQILHGYSRSYPYPYLAISILMDPYTWIFHMNMGVTGYGCIHPDSQQIVMH